MPNYNVTFTTTFTSKVTASSPQEAIETIQSVSDNESDFDITVVNVEEIPPPTLRASQAYVSLHSFHNQQAQAQEQLSSEYVRFTTAASEQTSTTYIPLIRSFI